MFLWSKFSIDPSHMERRNLLTYSSIRRIDRAELFKHHFLARQHDDEGEHDETAKYL